MKEMIRVHLLISGRVQGVFFRDNMRRLAKKFKINGWVKNLFDGQVEAVLEGEKKSVEKVVNWAKRGPILAKVEKIEIDWQEYKDEFSDFEIRYEI